MLIIINFNNKYVLNKKALRNSNNIADNANVPKKKRTFFFFTKEQNIPISDKLFDENKFYDLWSLGLPKNIRMNMWPIIIGNSSCITEELIRLYQDRIESKEIINFEELQA